MFLGYALENAGFSQAGKEKLQDEVKSVFFSTLTSSIEGIRFSSLFYAFLSVLHKMGLN